MKKIFLIFLVTILLFLSSCGKEIPDCSLQDTTYEKYTYNEELEQCVQSQSVQKNVCGNNVVENDETSCNCPSDVSINLPIDQGGCSGSKGEYLEYYCAESTKTCELAVTDKVSRKPLLLNYKNSVDFEIEAQTYYYTPFMTDRHNVEVELFLKNKLDTESVKIANLELKKAYFVTRGNSLLGTIDLNKKLEKQFDEYSFNLPVNQYDLETFNEKVYDPTLRFLITYTKNTYSKGELVKSEDKVVELEREFSNDLDLIDPDNKNEDLEEVSSGWSSYR